MDQQEHYYLHEFEVAAQIVKRGMRLYVVIPGAVCEEVKPHELKEQDGFFAVYAVDPAVEMTQENVDRLVDQNMAIWLGDVDGDDKGVVCGGFLLYLYE